MPDRGPVLFVDDEASMREAVTQWLELAGFDLVAHDNAAAALDHLNRDFRGALVTDLKMEGMDGLALLRRSQEVDPELPVVVITGHGDVETAVEAMRLGAYDFIEKPFAPERLLEIVRHASEKRQLVLENRRLRRAVNEQTLAARIIGNSRAAEALRSSVAELAGTDVSVILCGETGTGKDLIARCLHDFGRRQKGNYVAINCAAVPETMVESEFFGAASDAPGGAILGAEPGEEFDGTEAWLSATRGAPEFRQPVLTFAENQLIRAEAQYRTNAQPAALATMNAYRASVGLGAKNGLTGAALLQAIMEEKYVALFQNTEVWNDYRRTCYPNLTPASGTFVPARLVYGTDERRANPNIPSPSQQPKRNQDDPPTATSTSV